MEGSEQRELHRWIGKMMGKQATLAPAGGSDPRDRLAFGPPARSAPGVDPDRLTLPEQTHARVNASTKEEPPRSDAVPELPAPEEPEVELSDLNEEYLKRNREALA